MASVKPPTIAVITATKNAENYLPILVSSLVNQTDKLFEWVVCDGGSIDTTLKIIAESSICQKAVHVRDDFGIYDALNAGIKCISADYYLVVGADDTLAPDAVARYKDLASQFLPDFIAAAVSINGNLIKPKRGLGWLFGMPGEASSHSVGLLIRTDLHKKMGMYSSKFPIAADQLFVMSCLNAKANIIRADFKAGTFGTDGTSGSDDFGMITELFRVQTRIGRNLTLQVILVIARIAKAYLISCFRRSY